VKEIGILEPPSPLLQLHQVGTPCKIFTYIDQTLLLAGGSSYTIKGMIWKVYLYIIYNY
jgi:hypothetical protein